MCEDVVSQLGCHQEVIKTVKLVDYNPNIPIYK